MRSVHILPLVGIAVLATAAARAVEKPEPTKGAAPKLEQIRPEPEKATTDRAAAALSLLQQIDEGFVAVFEKVAPAVVVIDARKKAEADEEADEARGLDFFFRDGAESRKDSDKEGDKEAQRLLRLPPPVRSEGSGFIIRSDGYILTNNHVIDDAEKIEVRLKDGRILPGRLVGADEKTDIAVLKIEGRDLPVARLGDSEKLRVGQLVCAIGTPFNQDYSFTCGWVSGKGRTNLMSPSSNTILYEDYIQTDAFINPGNSGGPLFDVSGSVIGMNTLINGVGRGLAFAIPSDMLADVSAQLIANGKVHRPWLGIRIETLSANSQIRDMVSVEHGIIVRTIEPSAPAYRSDLRPADIITAVDGVKLSSAHDLQKEVLKKHVGQVITLTVWRAGSVLKVPVATGELPGELSKVNNVPAPAEKSAEPTAKLRSWGLKLQDRPKPSSGSAGSGGGEGSGAAGAGARKAEKAGGAVVEAVEAKSAAEVADLRSGDVITEIEGKPVLNAAEAQIFLNALLIPAVGEGKERKAILLNIERNGRRSFVVLAN